MFLYKGQEQEYKNMYVINKKVGMATYFKLLLEEIGLFGSRWLLV